MKRITAVEIENAVREQCGRGYKMSLVGDAARVVIEAVNIGIDEHLEAAFIRERGDYYSPGRGRLEACVSPESLAVLVRRLSESETEDGPSLAGDILQTLGFNVEGDIFQIVSRADLLPTSA